MCGNAPHFREFSLNDTAAPPPLYLININKQRLGTGRLDFPVPSARAKIVGRPGDQSVANRIFSAISTTKNQRLPEMLEYQTFSKTDETRCAAKAQNQVFHKMFLPIRLWRGREKPAIRQFPKPEPHEAEHLASILFPNPCLFEFYQSPSVPTKMV